MPQGKHNRHTQHTTDNKINIGCRFCKTGRIIADTTKLVDEETSASKKHQQMPYSNQDEYSGKFSLLYRCNNPRCSDIYIVSGDVSFEEIYDYGDDEHGPVFKGYDRQYYPKFFWPPIDIFNIDQNVPNNISDEIRKSFSLYFVDTNAAANRIRVAIEYLLSELKISTHSRTGSRYTLHNRIELLKKKRKGLSEQLFAIKWIGNSGSHMENLSKNDVLDAYEITEHIIHELYSRRTNTLHIKTIAKEININRGPRKN